MFKLCARRTSLLPPSTPWAPCALGSCAALSLLFKWRQQPRHVGLAGVQQQVRVIAHQAMSQQLSVKAGHDLSNEAQVHLPVVVTAVTGLAAVYTRRDVVCRAREFDANGTGLVGSLGQMRDLIPGLVSS